ncbi:MAG TPA: DNA gyrase inhibitor YacG [Gammaproteobacteria bacterium]
MTRVACPTCKKSVEWSEQQKWRPFCSERCKLIDLGEWASETHRIPCEPANPWELPLPGEMPHPEE